MSAMDTVVAEGTDTIGSNTSSGGIIKKDRLIRHGAHAKRVTFSDSLAVVVEFEDDPDLQEGRKLYWEMLARDRARFKDRIDDVTTVISPILEESHRNQVYSRLQKVTVTSSTTPPIMWASPPLSYAYQSGLVEQNNAPVDTPRPVNASSLPTWGFTMGN